MTLDIVQSFSPKKLLPPEVQSTLDGVSQLTDMEESFDAALAGSREFLSQISTQNLQIPSNGDLALDTVNATMRG